MLDRRYGGIRDVVSNAFHRFGNHCANHQIRVILISCVVITSLFYPALAIYWTAKPLSHLSSKWLEALYGTHSLYSSKPTTQLVDDIKDLWTGLDGLVVVDDSWTMAKCAKGATVRLERVLIHSDNEPDTGSLTMDTILEASDIQEALTEMIDGKKTNALLPCIRGSNDNCLALSPLNFWNTSLHDLQTSNDVLRNINAYRGATVAGVHVTPDMTLSGRSIIADAAYHIGYARFLVLTYFFEEDDCTGNTRHNEWLHTLSQVESSSRKLRHGVEPATLVALQYDPTYVSSFPLLNVCLYVAYIVFFFYFSGSLRKMDTVHSRWGLAFTGLIEIVASTITSVSVCAIVGFRPRMIPWSILPIVIVFVGAENMFILVDAVVKTPITLPVRERIAVGLSRAGTSNTLKVVSYNAILGTIAALSRGAIREFCAFATVVLIAHWFLIHTFFVAVLSIDIQRLELSELLSQDPSLQPPVPPTPRRPGNSPMSFIFGKYDIRKLLKGRPARNISLVLLLAMTGILYYISLPPVPTTSSEHPPVTTRVTAPTGPLSPSWQLWSTLNPSNYNVLHLRIEPPSVLTLIPNAHNPRPPTKSYWLRTTFMRLNPLWWTLKIVILPIAATTGLLYLVLLYLLKNKDLLDSKQHPQGKGKELLRTKSSSPIEENVGFCALPRACATDFRIMKMASDGSMAVTVSMEDDVVLWELRENAFVPLPLCDSLHLEIQSDKITSLALDSNKSFVAVGCESGNLIVWDVPSVSRAPNVVRTWKLKSAIVELVLISPDALAGASPPSKLRATPKVVMLIATEDLQVWYGRVDVDRGLSRISPTHPDSVYRTSFVSSPGDSETWIVFFHDTGAVEFIRNREGTWTSVASFHAGNSVDPATKVSVLKTGFTSGPTHIAATSTKEGVVILWNLTSESCIHILEDAFSQIGHMRLFPLPSKPCPRCCNAIPDAVALSFSVGYQCVIFKVEVEPKEDIPICNCTQLSGSIGLEQPINGRRSRSGSINATTTLRTRRSLSGLLTNGDSLAPFPVSPHGVHSRRATSDAPLTLSPLTTIDLDHNDRDTRKISPILTPVNQFARRTVCSQVSVFSFNRGRWDLYKSQIIGIRKRDTNLSSIKSPNGHDQSSYSSQLFALLPPSVLEKWEVFALDLSNINSLAFENSALEEKAMKVSSLGTLALRDRTSDENTTPAIKKERFPRLPFTRISCFEIGHGVCLAGLGNTAVALMLRPR